MRRRRYMVAARIGIATTGVAAVITLLIVGVMAVAPEARSVARPVDQNAAGTVTLASTAQPAARTAAQPAARTMAPARLEPSIAEGRRELRDSMFAVREGLQVTVHFDTETRRTRFDWKFEDVVRETLPLVFGADVRTALDSVPEGTLVRGDLLNDLPTRGIALEIPARGDSIRVWPVTRPGRDGPIVVAYRASVIG